LLSFRLLVLHHMQNIDHYIVFSSDQKLIYQLEYIVEMIMIVFQLKYFFDLLYN